MHHALIINGRGDMMAELYDRQQNLELNIPEKVCILGVGGVGSWVALNMALIGVEKLFLVDYDILEEHNLNRTPFRDIDIGEKKTTALMDIILERREQTNIRIFDKKIEELTELELNEIGTDCLILDCRDNLDMYPEHIKNNPRIKLGYDGLSITVILNPDYENLWDLEPDQGYTVVPSFLAPCQTLASIATTIVTNPNFSLEHADNEIVTFNIQKQFGELFNEQTLV